MMAKSEKQAIQQTVSDFAEAWGQHDYIWLRRLVDVDYPLEITRPTLRAGLKPEDVWQKIWKQRSQSQSKWLLCSLYVDFAFESAPRLLDAVPLNVEEWQADRTLPGLNVLAWLSANTGDGNEYKIGARLYLVKRPSGWKVYQFGLLHTADAVTP